jgi:hypothetical protein
MNALNDMNQSEVSWDCGTRGIGMLVSDSLMFQREQPTPSDPNMAHIYGQALPLVKRGIPVEPVQLENVGLPGFLDGFKLLTLSYVGQKPMSAEVHPPLADWVRNGGVLVVADDDSDPYNGVKEWWGDTIPRERLFKELGVAEDGFDAGRTAKVGKGAVVWLKTSPVEFALSEQEDERWVSVLRRASDLAGLEWRETAHLVLRRGPYVVAAGLEESPVSGRKVLEGRFVNLFDPTLAVRRSFPLEPGRKGFLLDLEEATGSADEPRVLASACKALPVVGQPGAWTVEGVGDTPAVLLLAGTAKEVTLDGEAVDFESAEGLTWVRFPNEPRPRVLRVR